MEALFDVRDGKRRVLVVGSFVNFHQDEYQSFSSFPNQGFIEEIDDVGEEVTIRSMSGKTFSNVSLHRVYL